MNAYAKSFLHRGLIFGGFGPVILGIVYWVLSLVLEDFSLGGDQVLCGVVSTYLLAFVHAGLSVVPQMEHLPIAKSALIHFGALYITYTACYLLNAWIPFDWRVLLIYTGIFAVGYLVVWGIVLLSIRSAQKTLNEGLKKT